MLLTQLITRALNQSDAVEASLADFAGRTFCIQFKPIAFKSVWRITADGKVKTVSKQIDADVVIRLISLPDNIKIEGDANLLQRFSALFQDIDWAVIISDAFGPVLAPNILLLLETLKEALAKLANHYLLDKETFLSTQQQISHLQQKIADIDKRLNTHHP